MYSEIVSYSLPVLPTTPTIHDSLVWSDHANYVANAYTGTGALRTDYTRTGVRTRKGVFMDKFTSLVRYILNNHIDGTKQVCLVLHAPKRYSHSFRRMASI